MVELAKTPGLSIRLMLTTKSCPFASEHALVFQDEDEDSSSRSGDDSTKSRVVPGFPLLAWHDRPNVDACLASELLTTELDTMAPYMWMMTTQSSANINSLHRQIVKGRDLVVAEDPQLHLVWRQDRIFVKPIPKCLLMYDFWCDAFQGPDQLLLRRAALGYLRTYRHLIRQESDLRIAQQDNLCLVPEGITWKQISLFLADLETIDDDQVSPRYAFGELRLSRLNFYGKFILRRFHYQRLHMWYGSYFGRFYGPLLFVFGLFALALGAFQVELAVEGLRYPDNIDLRGLSRGLALLTLAGLVLIIVVLFSLFLYLFIDEWQYAIRDKLRNGRKRQAVLKGNRDNPKSSTPA